MTHVRTFVGVSLLCMVAWACTDGPTTSGRAISLGIVPSFQVDPALFAGGPIDRIRLTAYEVETGMEVGGYDEPVSPTEDEWVLTVPIELGDAESLEVIVDAELFSGDEVAWSGRLGPITVPTAAAGLALDVSPGPLDNQDVESLTITGAPPVLVEGGTADLGASLTLEPNSDASPVVYWASSDTEIAIVTPQGPTATVTAVSEGTVDIIASAGPAYDEVAIEVLAPGTATKTWVGGTAGGATLWSEPDNWTPVGVPSTSDIVLIPATANDPELDGAVAITGLTVQSGASVDLMQQSLDVSQDLVATGLVANGTVELTGAGGLLEGNLDGLLVGADRTLSGTLQLSSDLRLAALLSVGGESLYVGGGFATEGSGRLGMTSADAFVSVSGDASFQGGSQESLLTLGRLIVSGDFVAGGDPASFAADATHTVVLSGGVAQTIDFAQAGPAAGRFGTLQIDNASGVSLAGDAHASVVTLNGSLSVPAGQTFDIEGTLTLQSGSTFQVDGVVTASECVDNGALILGGGTHPCGESQAFTKVWVGGDTGGGPTDWDNPANWDPPGVAGSEDTVLVNVSSNQPVLSTSTAVASIVVTNQSSVDLSTFSLQVEHDVDAGTFGFLNGTVTVQGAGDIFAGSFDRLDVIVDRTLSGPAWVSGRLAVFGDLVLGGTSLFVYDSVLVSGANARLVMTSPGDALYVEGDAVFDGGDHTDALSAGSTSVAGDFIVSSASTTGFAASGTHLVSFDGIDPQSVTFSSPGSAQQRFAEIWISNGSGVSFDTDAFTTSDAFVSGRMEVPAGSTVQIGGDLTLSSVAELHVDGTLVVQGTCDNQDALLQGGGDFDDCGAPAEVDYTWVGGADPDPYDWDDPDNWSPVGVPGPGAAVLVQGATYDPVLNGDVTLGGIVVGGGDYVDLNGFTMTVAGDVDASGGGLFGGLVVVSGAGSVLSGSFDALEIQADRTLSASTYVSTDLVLSAELDVADWFLSIGDSLSVVGPNARLVQKQPGAAISVGGTATFDGADHTDMMTEGSLLVGGDLIVTASSPTGFVSSGNHIVSLFGANPQTVSFDAPGPTGQRFGRLQLANAIGMTFTNGAHATGNVDLGGHLIVPASTTVGIDGALTLSTASTLEVYGTVTVVGSCTVFQGALILGDGTQPCGDPVTADRTWLGGDSGGESDWGGPGNWSPAGVPLATETVLIPSREYQPVMDVDRTVAELTVGPGAVLDLAGNTLTVSTNVAADGQVTNGLTQLVHDGATTYTARGRFDGLRIAGTGPKMLSGALVAFGDMSLEVRLDLGQYSLQVGGSLDVFTSLGGIRMADPLSYLSVDGKATFDGESSTGNLSQGTIYVLGDFVVGDTNVPDAFHSTGVLVYLLGVAAQTVTFSNPGSSAQVFEDVAMSGGTKNFASDVVMTGVLNASGVTVSGAAGTTFNVEGTGGIAFLNTVTFDGVSLRLVTDQNTDSHAIDDVTFTNMDTSVSQLYLELPQGTGSLFVDAPTFLTTLVAPDTGYYIEAVHTGGSQLVIDVNSPTPTDDGGFTSVTGDAVINWGP